MADKSGCVETIENIPLLLSDYVEQVFNNIAENVKKHSSLNIHLSEMYSGKIQSRMFSQFVMINNYLAVCLCCQDHLYTHSSIHDINSFFQRHTNTEYHKLSRYVKSWSNKIPMFTWEEFGVSGRCNICEMSGLNATVFDTNKDMEFIKSTHICNLNMIMKPEQYERLIKICSVDLFREKLITSKDDNAVCLLCKKIICNVWERYLINYHLMSKQHCENFVIFIKQWLGYDLEDWLNGFVLEEKVVKTFLLNHLEFSMENLKNDSLQKEQCLKESNMLTPLYKNMDVAEYLEIVPNSIRDNRNDILVDIKPNNLTNNEKCDMGDGIRYEEHSRTIIQNITDSKHNFNDEIKNILPNEKNLLLYVIYMEMISNLITDSYESNETNQSSEKLVNKNLVKISEYCSNTFNHENNLMNNIYDLVMNSRVILSFKSSHNNGEKNNTKKNSLDSSPAHKDSLKEISAVENKASNIRSEKDITNKKPCHVQEGNVTEFTSEIKNFNKDEKLTVPKLHEEAIAELKKNVKEKNEKTKEDVKDNIKAKNQEIKENVEDKMQRKNKRKTKKNNNKDNVKAKNQEVKENVENNVKEKNEETKENVEDNVKEKNQERNRKLKVNWYHKRFYFKRRKTKKNNNKDNVKEKNEETKENVENNVKEKNEETKENVENNVKEKNEETKEDVKNNIKEKNQEIKENVKDKMRRKNKRKTKKNNNKDNVKAKNQEVKENVENNVKEKNEETKENVEDNVKEKNQERNRKLKVNWYHKRFYFKRRKTKKNNNKDNVKEKNEETKEDVKDNIKEKNQEIKENVKDKMRRKNIRKTKKNNNKDNVKEKYEETKEDVKDNIKEKNQETKEDVEDNIKEKNQEIKENVKDKMRRKNIRKTKKNNNKDNVMEKNHETKEDVKDNVKEKNQETKENLKDNSNDNMSTSKINDKRKDLKKAIPRNQKSTIGDQQLEKPKAIECNKRLSKSSNIEASKLKTKITRTEKKNYKNVNQNIILKLTNLPENTKALQLHKFLISLGDKTIKDVEIQNQSAFLIVSDSKKAKHFIENKIVFNGNLLKVSELKNNEKQEYKASKINKKNNLDETFNFYLMNPNEMMKSIHVHLAISNGNEIFELKKNMILCEKIEIALRKKFPNAKCHPFGSRLTGAVTDHSDLDVYVDLDVELDKYSSSYRRLPFTLTKLLSSSKLGFCDFNPVIFANVPLVSFYDQDTKLKCDLSFKWPLSVLNSVLIKFLFSLDERFKKLVLIVKNWSQNNSLHGKRLFSSYALTMMLIFYLQQLSPPILPPIELLKKNYQGKRLTISGWDASFSTDPSVVPKYANSESVPTLLLGFFKFCARFPYNEYLMSPLTGQPVLREALIKDVFKLPMAIKRHYHVMSPDKFSIYKLSKIMVLDPFNLSHNLTSRFPKKHFTEFLELCEESAELLQKGIELSSSNN